MTWQDWALLAIIASIVVGWVKRRMASRAEAERIMGMCRRHPRVAAGMASRLPDDDRFQAIAAEHVTAGRLVRDSDGTLVQP